MSAIRGKPPPPGALGEGGCGPAKIMGSGEGKDAHPLGSPPPPADRTNLAAFKEVLPTEGGGAPTLCAPPLLAPLFPNTAQHPKPFACPLRHLSRNSSDPDRRLRFRPSLPNGFVPFASRGGRPPLPRPPWTTAQATGSAFAQPSPGHANGKRSLPTSLAPAKADQGEGALDTAGRNQELFRCTLRGGGGLHSAEWRGRWSEERKGGRSRSGIEGIGLAALKFVGRSR